MVNRVAPILTLCACALILAPAVSADPGEPVWFRWVKGDWAKLTARGTPIADWTGGLIGGNWRANGVRAAGYILYRAPCEGGSVDEVPEGHVPGNGAPVRFGELGGSESEGECAGTVAAHPVAARSAEPLIVSEDANAECPPWVDPTFLAEDSSLEFPRPSGDRFLLVVPLWREDDRYRVILGVYGTEGLCLPRGTRVYRVLVPSRVVRMYWKVITYAPWNGVRYSLRESDGLLYLRPARIVGRTFVVEAGLPARDGWVRIALTPGDWIVALGWTMDFDLLTLDGKVLFRGRHPYDEVEYDLPGGVHLAFWVFFYALDLGGRWGREWDWDNVPWRFDPRWQHEHGVYYGYGTVLEVRTGKPLILEFRAPRPGTQLETPTTLVFNHEFVTYRYVESHSLPLPYVEIPGRERSREAPERRTMGPVGAVVLAVLVSLARFRSVGPAFASRGS